MRQTFVVVTIVLGLLLWVVAIVYAEPARCRLAVLQASAGYGRAVLAARQRCEESLFKGKTVPCPRPRRAREGDPQARADDREGLRREEQAPQRRRRGRAVRDPGAVTLTPSGGAP
jgi:hypothetical protein